jgi:predicted XRE-type DNA-binding protein
MKRRIYSLDDIDQTHVFLTCDLIRVNGSLRYLPDLVFADEDDARSRFKPAWECPLACPVVIRWPTAAGFPDLSDVESHHFPYYTDAELADVGADVLPNQTQNTRLTGAQRAEIRRRYADEDVLQRELADEFGVDQSTISKVVRNG